MEDSELKPEQRTENERCVEQQERPGTDFGDWQDYCQQDYGQDNKTIPTPNKKSQPVSEEGGGCG